MTTTTTPPPKEPEKKKEESSWKFYLLMGFLGLLALILIGTVIYFIFRKRGGNESTPAALPNESIPAAPVANTPVPTPVPMGTPPGAPVMAPVGTPVAPNGSPSPIPTAELPPFVPMYGPKTPVNRPDSFDFTPTPGQKVGGRGGRGRGKAATKSSWKGRARK